LFLFHYCHFYATASGLDQRLSPQRASKLVGFAAAHSLTIGWRFHDKSGPRKAARLRPSPASNAIFSQPGSAPQ
jgi:hypothetical protein